MKRTVYVVIAALAAALMLASVAGAENAKNQAKKLTAAQCKAEKKADKRAFKATYGKRAMRSCKKSELSETRHEIRNAAQECRAEREEIGKEAFQEQYGSNKNKRNAFGKCVSSKVRAEQADDAEEFRNAAQECRAEREEIGKEAFQEQYGSNKNKRNAFGKCVSSKVKDAGGDDEYDEAPADAA